MRIYPLPTNRHSFPTDQEFELLVLRVHDLIYLFLFAHSSIHPSLDPFFPGPLPLSWRSLQPSRSPASIQLGLSLMYIALLHLHS